MNGQTWVAAFSHQHTAKDILTGKEIGIIRRNILDGKIIERQKLRHITTCKLSAKGHSVGVTGVSPCSLKDHYDWKTGVKRSFQKALEACGFCKIKKVAGVDVVTPLQPEYAGAMASFFRELPIKAYFPHNANPEAHKRQAEKAAEHYKMPIKDGEVMAEVPIENRMGTYHQGA